MRGRGWLHRVDRLPRRTMHRPDLLRPTIRPRQHTVLSSTRPQRQSEPAGFPPTAFQQLCSSSFLRRHRTAAIRLVANSPPPGAFSTSFSREGGRAAGLPLRRRVPAASPCDLLRPRALRRRRVGHRPRASRADGPQPRRPRRGLQRSRGLPFAAPLRRAGGGRSSLDRYCARSSTGSWLHPVSRPRTRRGRDHHETSTGATISIRGWDGKSLARTRRMKRFASRVQRDQHDQRRAGGFSVMSGRNRHLPDVRRHHVAADFERPMDVCRDRQRCRDFVLCVIVIAERCEKCSTPVLAQR